MDHIATIQNPSSMMTGPQRRTLCAVWLLWLSRKDNKAIPVSSTGTSSNAITCGPFSSISVALDRVTSLLGSPLGDAGVTDTPWYTGPNARKAPGAQANAWATHADTFLTLMDLNTPSVPTLGWPGTLSYIEIPEMTVKKRLITSANCAAVGPR